METADDDGNPPARAERCTSSPSPPPPLPPPPAARPPKALHMHTRLPIAGCLCSKKKGSASKPPARKRQARGRGGKKAASSDEEEEEEAEESSDDEDRSTWPASLVSSLAAPLVVPPLQLQLCYPLFLLTLLRACSLGQALLLHLADRQIPTVFLLAGWRSTTKI